MSVAIGKMQNTSAGLNVWGWVTKVSKVKVSKANVSQKKQLALGLTPSLLPRNLPVVASAFTHKPQKWRISGVLVFLCCLNVFALTPPEFNVSSVISYVFVLV